MQRGIFITCSDVKCLHFEIISQVENFIRSVIHCLKRTIFIKGLMRFVCSCT
jgi:hypothetical protein